MMIRELAQIVFRQVCAPSRRILDEPDPPPTLCPIIGPTPCTEAAAWGTAASDAGREPEALSQALGIVFTQLAQRRVQAARAQEETYEYGSHHHSPPGADGLRLRQAIHPVAGEGTSRNHRAAVPVASTQTGTGFVARRELSDLWVPGD